MIKTRESAMRGVAMVGLGMTAALAAGLLWAGAASAATIQCAGTTVPTDVIADEDNGLEYDFACDQEIKAYSIVSNRQLHYFNPEVLVFSSETGQPAGLIMFCEGNLPGAGFACSYRSSGGVVPANYRIKGELAPLKDPCPPSDARKKGNKKGAQASKAKKEPWGLNLVVATIQSVTNPTTGAVSTFTTTSDPFPLAMPSCGKST